MPYSMSVPFILGMYNFYFQNLSQIDMLQLKDYLSKVENDLGKIDSILENSICRAGTMIKNAYEDFKNLLGGIRRNIMFIKGRKSYFQDEDSGQG